jgi:hypothetical protein
LGPLTVLGIVVAASLATGGIVSLNGDMAESDIASVQADEMRTAKNHEQLKLVTDGDTITITNLGQKKSTILEFRDHDSTLRYQTSLDISPGKDNTITETQTGLDFSNEIYALTSFGNKFVSEQPADALNSEVVGAGTSILDGLGVYLAIHNINTNGKVYFGDTEGSQTDIRQYVAVEPSDTWAIAVSDDDSNIPIFVPEFGKEYDYSTGSLIDVTATVPNILGFSESTSMSGTNNVIIDSEGIHVSGTGLRVLKINPMEGVNMIYRTTIPSGASVDIVESPNDLTSFSHDGARFNLYSETVSSEATGSVVAGQYQCGYHPSQHYYIYCDYYAVTYSGVAGYPMTYVKGSVDDAIFSSYSGYTTVRDVSHSVTVPQDDNIQTSTVGDYTLIQQFSKSHSSGGHSVHISASFNIKEAEPYTSELLSTTNSEVIYTMPSGDLYLIVEPNGGTVDIKGESFDPLSDIFFEVDNLPPNTAFDISKDGIVGVVGKTSDLGEISLFVDEVDFGIDTSPGAILTIYPDSLNYSGSLGTGMMDIYNGESIPLPNGDDLVYIPQNYVRWVFPVPVEIENVKIDNTSLDYLNKNYTKNESVSIPVIPGATTMYASVNGTDVEILMRDVATTTQIKQVPKKSSTSSDHATSGTVSSSSNISTSTFLTATHDGTMNVNLDLKVAGSADFTMDSTYTGTYDKHTSCKMHGASSPHQTKSCRDYSVPTDSGSISNLASLTASHQTQLTNALSNGQVSQLTVEVDILKNMIFEDTVLIHTSTSSEASSTSTLSDAGYGASNQVHVNYPLESISENIAVPVSTGDMVEFIIRVNIDAVGAPTPSSNNAEYSAYVQTITEFGGGAITVGMS